MKKVAGKKSAEDYLPWAGRFANEDTDPEVAARHPGWWQRERKFIQEAVRARRPYTFADLEALHVAEAPVRIERHIPPSFALSSLKSRYHSTAPAKDVLYKLRQIVTSDIVLRSCTAFGEGRILLRKAPPQGLFAYIWVAALYQRKIIRSLPVSIFFDLENGIYSLTGLWFSVEQDADALFSWLDSEVSSLLSSVA